MTNTLAQPTNLNERNQPGAHRKAREYRVLRFMKGATLPLLLSGAAFLAPAVSGDTVPGNHADRVAIGAQASKSAHRIIAMWKRAKRTNAGITSLKNNGETVDVNLHTKGYGLGIVDLSVTGDKPINPANPAFNSIVRVEETDVSADGRMETVTYTNDGQGWQADISNDPAKPVPVTAQRAQAASERIEADAKKGLVFLNPTR